jgi:hypothetical protein
MEHQVFKTLAAVEGEDLDLLVLVRWVVAVVPE